MVIKNKFNVGYGDLEQAERDILRFKTSVT